MRCRISRTGMMIIAGAVASALSCSDSTSPVSLPGTYDLQKADGKLLPVRWNPPGGGDSSIFIQSGRLYVIDPDTMQVALTLEHVDNSGNVLDSFSGDSVFFNYVMVGDSVAEADPPGLYIHGNAGGGRVSVSVDYPIAPSTGYQFLQHRFDFRKR